MNVQQRIAAIIGELPAVEKKDSGQGVPYKFRGIETLIGHLSNLLAKHGVIIVPSSTLVSIGEVAGRDGKPMGGWTDAVLAVDWKVYGPDGDFIEARTYGIGRDNSDKGTNKAQTQAYKYLLMELFAIGDKEDDGDGIAPPAPAAVDRPRSETPPPASVPAAQARTSAAAARGRAAAEAAASTAAPADPVPVPPEQAGAAMALGPEVLARMELLLAATPELNANQRQVKVGRIARGLGKTPDSITAMVADDEVWEAVRVSHAIIDPSHPVP